MLKLNFPVYEFRFSQVSGKQMIFDPVRKKFVALTPEEWVRQHLIAYMINDRYTPPGLIGVEKQLLVNQLSRRFDVVVFARNGMPLVLIECKAPTVPITAKTFDQAARYNLVLHVDYFILSNGLETFCCKVDYASQSYQFLDGIPAYAELA